MTARRVLAAMWLVLVATAAIGDAIGEWRVLVFAWFAALALLGGSGSSIKAERDERLERPRLYSAIAAVGFAIPLAGALLTWVPHHSDLCTLLAPYFVLSAWLTYRALVARGPRPALLAMCTSLLVWPPFMVFVAMGCKCGHEHMPPPHWTEGAAWLALLATQLWNAVTVAASLVSFARRKEFAPEARLRAG